ncbi:hypothetical protein CPB84DRAFT_1759080 [Gymnopilus junonius]|uniref:RRM domain-containing protein n=1 Tax=Gymnopilus junonius TaxID=109634 RepID=A0A9P5P5A6_GYMJU|nr:hypothetical protein CPB84DRAFT_1759080 [Gymnopilus junonius]
MSSSASSSRSASPGSEVHENKRKRKDIVREGKEELSSDDSDSESENEAEEPFTDDEPVLSHKERRRKKKEEKLAAKLVEAGKAVKKRKLEDGAAKIVDSSSTKRQNSIWVGNMSFKTAQDNLKTFFKDCGEVTRIHMPTKPPTGPGVKPENRGYAYVDFATPESKKAAIALSEQPLLGRKLLIKDGDDFAGRPAAIAGDTTIADPTLAHKTHSKTAQKILRAQKQPPAPTLFFGNLGFDTTEDSIRDLLEAHKPRKNKGKEILAGTEEEDSKSKDAWIRKVRMGTFEDSGLCKGPDAVRRGAPKSKSVDGPARKFKPEPRSDRFQRSFEKAEQVEQKVERVQDPTETPANWPRDGKARASAKPDGVRHKGPKSRPKPGAALALAKRESAAIIPSQGRKITF